MSWYLPMYSFLCFLLSFRPQPASHLLSVNNLYKRSWHIEKEPNTFFVCICKESESMSEWRQLRREFVPKPFIQLSKQTMILIHDVVSWHHVFQPRLPTITLSDLFPSEPWYLIMEYLPNGNLQGYLRKVRIGQTTDLSRQSGRRKSVADFPPNDLLTFAVQIARGMEFLSSQAAVSKPHVGTHMVLPIINAAPLRDCVICQYTLFIELIKNEEEFLYSFNLPIRKYYGDHVKGNVLKILIWYLHAHLQK